MFINFSNHPLDGWSPEQIASARELGGRLVDLVFPAVPPEADEAAVAAIAEDYADRILSLLDKNAADENLWLQTMSATMHDDHDTTRGNDPGDAVHVMGEHTLVHGVVSRLLDAGVRCVASTTNRNSTINPDGTKTSQFTFVRFRDYEPAQ